MDEIEQEAAGGEEEVLLPGSGVNLPGDSGDEHTPTDAEKAQWDALMSGGLESMDQAAEQIPDETTDAPETETPESEAEQETEAETPAEKAQEEGTPSAMAEAEALAAKLTGAPETTPPTAKTEIQHTPPPAVKTQTPPEAAPTAGTISVMGLQLADKVLIDGKEISTQEIVDNLGDLAPDVLALAKALQQGANGPDPAQQQAVSELQSELAVIKANQANENFLSESSRLAKYDVRTLFNQAGGFKPEFQTWLDAQSEGIRRLTTINDPACAAAVAKAYAESQLAGHLATIDADKAKAKERQNKIYRAPKSSGAADTTTRAKQLTPEDEARLPESERARLWKEAMKTA